MSDQYSADEAKWKAILDDLDDSSPECMAAIDALEIIKLRRELAAMTAERDAALALAAKQP